MTEREEIDMLRRQVADLMERMHALEARHPSPAVAPPIGVAPFRQNPFVITCGPSPAIPSPHVRTSVGGGLRDGTAALSWA